MPCAPSADAYANLTDFQSVLDEFGATDFVGREEFETKATVLAVVGDSVFLDRSPFYAESGGQVGDTGTILASTNGDNWVQRVSGTEIALLAIAYGNDQFVAVGSGYNTTNIVTSTDGVNWVQPQSGTTDGFVGIAYGNGVFVAVGDLSSHSNIVATSANGVNWVRRQVVTPADGPLGAIAYGNGQFVAVSRPNGRNSFVLTSADGSMTWRELDDASTALAAGYLGLGLRRGDRLASLMPNRPALVANSRQWRVRRARPG